MLRPVKFDFWWLRPTVCFVAISGITLLLAYFQNRVDFELYGMLKYVEGWHVLVGFLFFGVFAMGSYFGQATADPNQPQGELNYRVIRRWFYLCVGLTIFGYLVWFSVGFKNGASPAMILEIFTTHNAELVESIRKEYFVSIPGITTCTQFGLSAMLLGIWLFFLGDKKALWGLAAVAALGLFRALLFSERSALIELGVPSTLLIIRAAVLVKDKSTWMRKAGIILPFVAPLALAILFGAFEYVRSWHYYEDKFDNYPQFVVWRLSGYYTTSHNNSVMAIEIGQRRPLPFYTLRPFWEFPGVSASPFGYEKLTGIDPAENHTDMLENFGNPELNNEGGLYQPMIDWGLPGALIFWVGYGFISGRLYAYYLQGRTLGVLLYPVFFYSLMEIPRVLMICYTRLTPTLLTLVMVALTVHVTARQEQRVPKNSLVT